MQSSYTLNEYFCVSCPGRRTKKSFKLRVMSPWEKVMWLALPAAVATSSHSLR